MGEGELVGVTEKLKRIAQFVRKEMEEYRKLICGELNCKGVLRIKSSKLCILSVVE